ncbi:MAG: leucine-rich repeat domain-containing protein [Muribaculaceae bacterium]|nr:leucine-rich repeat domain-containing protein [Muribaculaceae bacterium]
MKPKKSYFPFFKAILCSLVLFVSFNSRAKEVVLDGIKYDLNKYDRTAVVRGLTVKTAQLIIPSTISANGTVYTVNEIGSCAFHSCDFLTSIIIPESVITIGDNAFNSTSIKSIIIPDSVTELGTSAFFYCRNLESIVLSDSLHAIEDGTFDQCVSLTSITLPSSIRKIGMFAFSLCKSLESITIPYSVIEIGISAFVGCDKLSSITIMNPDTRIGEYAFDDCPGWR